jgi:hypothetical protein
VGKRPADPFPPGREGEARLRQVFEQAGYTQFRLATQTPLNMILQATP